MRGRVVRGSGDPLGPCPAAAANGAPIRVARHHIQRCLALCSAPRCRRFIVHPALAPGIVLLVALERVLRRAPPSSLASAARASLERRAGAAWVSLWRRSCAAPAPIIRRLVRGPLGSAASGARWGPWVSNLFAGVDGSRTRSRTASCVRTNSAQAPTAHRRHVRTSWRRSVGAAPSSHSWRTACCDSHRSR